MNIIALKDIKQGVLEDDINVLKMKIEDMKMDRKTKDPEMVKIEMESESRLRTVFMLEAKLKRINKLILVL